MIVRSDDHRKIVMSIADFEKDVTDAEAKAVVKNVENNSIVIMIYWKIVFLIYFCMCQRINEFLLWIII